MPSKNQQIKNLVQLNDELENYFRNTIIPQLFVDANLILRKFSPPAMKQFSLSKDDLGKSIDEVKENFRFPTIIENIQHVIDSNEILEKEIQTTDLRWYQMNIIPYVELKNSKVNGVILTFVEITMRIKDLTDLEKLIAENELILDTISHDIKSPLTSMILTISVLKKMTSGSPQQLQSLLNTVESSIKKMQSVIQDLTDIRKQEHKFKAEEELLSFEHILEDVRLALADNIKESGALIRSEINFSEIFFSRRKLRSIVYNLVNNAIKFRSTDARPIISIKTEREDNFMIITIKDNGIGIDSDKQAKVFSKYFRAENVIEGSGIGLYLVKEIVTTSGGKIELESDRGKGAQFKVFLKI